MRNINSYVDKHIKHFDTNSLIYGYKTRVSIVDQKVCGQCSCCIIIDTAGSCNRYYKYYKVLKALESISYLIYHK